MHGDPALWHDLCARLAQISGAFLRVQVEAGASAVQLFDSWVGALPRGDYAAYVQEHSAAALSAVADLGVPRIHFGVGTGELLAPWGRPVPRSSAWTTGCRSPTRSPDSRDGMPCRATSIAAALRAR